MILKQMVELKKMVDTMQKQGKTETEIKQSVSLYLMETKKKINPHGDLDIV